jgi:ABC-type polysaccharide/polyol phosphate export permease
LDVYYRDTHYVVESALTILFWLTPIFYPLDFIRLRLPPFFTNLFILNPMAGCIEGARRAILYQSCPDLRAYCAAIVVSLGTFVAGIIVFQRMQRRFADFL